MSHFDNKHFYATFPFSPSRLRDLPSQDRGSGGTGLQCAGMITGPGIPDLPAELRGSGTMVQRDEATTPAAPQSRRETGQPQARIRRVAPPPGPVRLLPLAAFVWGSRALPPQPRTRADHTLIWVTSGRLHLDFPRRHYPMRPGDLRFIPAGTAFAALPMQGAQGHVALLPADLMASVTAGLSAGLAASVGPEGSRLLMLLRRMTQIDRAAAAGHAAELASCLGGLMQDQPRPAEQVTAPQNRGLVERFLELAGQRLGEGGSLAEMASELRSSMAALDRACIAARGRRAIELIHDLRLEHAAILLRQGSDTPAQIAVRLGYSSHAHFTRAFIAATGRTPEVFRAQPC